MKNKAVIKVMPPQGVSIASRMKDVLEMLGEDPSREGLVQTPERYEKAMRYLTSGYTTSLDEIVNNALFTVKVDSMVIVKDIEFFSMCEHHMLPFFGKMHVAYLPKDKVIGLSKIPRIIDMYARRLQLQERLTQQVAEAMSGVISPRGVGVLCEARHFCMMMRGVEKQHSGTVTSTMLGSFRTNKSTRDEFLSLVNRPV
ncbi:MAG TPA: GTP cyclohydrolase I FolE [Bryobacteraceae bacterium]|jgi:GTP cyclohydrolase I|nr:GTP cyclohydrolase I FolE [Bryobacteraceae bacterium]